jgi:plastocyanin
MRSTLKTLALCLTVAALAACGGDDKKPASSSGGGGGGDKAPAETGGGGGGAAYDKAKGTASIRVTAKFEGTPPAAPEFYVMTSADACAAHNGKVPKEVKEVNANGTVPHCFVTVEGDPIKSLSGFAEGAPKTMDQKDCTYIPHVMGVMVKQPVVFKNSDPTSHNVHATPKKNSDFNKSQSANASDTTTFPKAEDAIPINCDIHTWMKAYIFVMKHPFHDVTARESGQATISGLYPGKYTVKVWHETYASPPKTVEVEVKDGETKDVSVSVGK